MRPKPRHVRALGLPEMAEPIVQNGYWLVPSRNRQERALACIEACAAAGQETRGLLVQDGCHYSFARSVPSVGRKLYPGMPRRWGAIETPEHRELVGALTYASDVFPAADWYGVISDGIRPKTQGWDRALLAASAGRNIVSCRDDWRNDTRMAGITVVPGWIVRAMGYWAPPGLIHLFSDDCLEQIAGALDNWLYAEDVVVEDNHHGHTDPAHVVPFDTPRTFRGKDYNASDRQRFNDWRYGPEFFEAVDRIKQAWKLATGQDWQQAAA